MEKKEEKSNKIVIILVSLIVVINVVWVGIIYFMLMPKIDSGKIKEETIRIEELQRRIDLLEGEIDEARKAN